MRMQAAEEEEERRNNRPNYALSEDVTAPQPSSARPGGPRRAPLKELARTDSILSTQSTRRGYDYSLEAAPDAQQARKHLNTFAVSCLQEPLHELGLMWQCCCRCAACCGVHAFVQ